jgi:NADH:ubiquinone oxidoreductase subunit 6 (subunit J)
MTPLLRERLTRLDVMAVCSLVGAVVALIVSAISWYLGFSAAEDSGALPYSPEPAQVIGVTVAAVLFLCALTAWVTGILLQRSTNPR